MREWEADEIPILAIVALILVVLFILLGIWKSCEIAVSLMHLVARGRG